jgi:diguanylate cyclase (GGDEF)-like protein
MYFLIFIVAALPLFVMAEQPSPVKGPITIALNKSSFPYHFKNEQGMPAGIMVDFWSLWAKKQNIDVEFIILDDWSNTLELVANGTIDLHAGLAINEERQGTFDFTTPLFFHDSHVFLHKDIEGINHLSQLQPYTLGVVKNSAHKTEINRLQPNLQLRVYDNRKMMFDAAIEGEILAFANLDKSFKEYDNYDKLSIQFPSYQKINYYSGKYASAVTKGRKNLLQFIEQGLAKISVDEKRLIENQWRKSTRSNNALRLVFTPNLPPYMATSPEGNPQGLFIDIWRLWSKLTGRPVEFIAENMTEAITLINQNGADIHIAYPGKDFSDTGLIPANDVYTVFSQVYVSNHLPNVITFDDLSGKTLGVFKTAPYKNDIAERYPNIKIRYFSGFDTLLKAAELKQIDAMVASIENMNTQLINSNLQSSFYTIKTINFQSKISSLVSNDNEKLVKSIKDGFDIMPLNELVALERTWLRSSDNGYFHHLKNNVALTDAEMDWLQLNQPIKIGIDPLWKPIEFIDESGQFMGINPDVTRLIADRTGIQFSFVMLDGWDALYKAMLSGDIDVLAGANQTVERDELFLFSEPYWDIPSVIVHQNELGSNLSLQDFYGKSLAIVRGSYIVSFIQKRYPSIVVKIVDGYDEALLAVQRGLVDGLIENIATASDLINRESLVSLTISVVDEFENDKHYFAIQQNTPLLKSILDKAIINISDKEKQTIYEKWFTINVETGYNKGVVMRVSAQIGLILLLIMIFIVLWNRRLRGEILSRKQLEQQMKHMATHDELTGLANRVLLKDRITTAINVHQRTKLQMAVLFIDLDGFKNINDNYGHDVGDELLIKVATTLSTCVRKSDNVVRFGGDEFVLLLTSLHSKEEARYIAEKVLVSMQKPFSLSAVTAQIGCSIGIAMYPDDGDNHVELVKTADTLMYKVKGAGKNHYVFT